jgi:ZIP family zinc transporter
MSLFGNLFGGNKELIPEMLNGTHSHTGVVLFAVGFTLMMVLDVALG